MANQHRKTTQAGLESLRAKGANLRAKQALGGDDDLHLDTKILNIGQKTRRLLRAEGAHEGKKRLMFRCPELNLAIISKEVVRNGADYGLRPAQLATKLTLPYELSEFGSKHVGNSRAIYVGETHYRKAMQDLLFGDMDPIKVDHDLRVIELFNSVPSLDPFLLKDQFQMAGLAINPRYLELGEAEWRGLCAWILDHFRHIVRRIFQEDNNLEERTRILVEKLWSSLDMDSLQPLVTALQLERGQAQEAFYAWKGIIFYSHKYEHTIRQFREANAYIDQELRPQMGHDLKDGTRVDWPEIFQSFTRFQRDVQSVVQQYQQLAREFGAPGTSGRFRYFLSIASDLFWLLGSNLACMDHVATGYQRLMGASSTRADQEAYVRSLVEINRFNPQMR